MPVERDGTPIPLATRASAGRLVPLAAVVAAAILVFAMGWHRKLSLEHLVQHRDALEVFITGHYALALLAFIALYVAAVALSIPGAAFLTIGGGVLFGWLVGGIAAVIGATIGAAIIFLVAKTAIGEHFVHRAGPRLARLAHGFRADAFSYLLFLRLVPVFPFVLVNLAPALVGVRLTTFVAATALGIIPGTFVFASVGAGLDSVLMAQQYMYQECIEAGRADCRLQFDPAAALTPQLLVALAALGLLALVPVVVKRLYGRRSAIDGREEIG